MSELKILDTGQALIVKGLSPKARFKLAEYIRANFSGELEETTEADMPGINVNVVSDVNGPLEEILETYPIRCTGLKNGELCACQIHEQIAKEYLEGVPNAK